MTHVTDHKVECTHCHLEIEHVVPRHLETARTECETCHGSGHSPQRDLYAGIGGKGVEPMPDVMYLAGIRCEGCHLDEGEGVTRTASAVSCMSCHGPGYRNLYATWRDAIESRTRALRRQMDRTTRQIGGQALEDLGDAHFNLRLVEQGRGVHNYRYSLALLDASHEQMNAARARAGLSAVETPWAVASYESDCLGCHAGIELQRGRSLGPEFSHSPHVVDAGLECTSCHSTHEAREREDLSALLIGASDCATCHHGPSQERRCADCHSGIMDRTLETDLGDFDHSLHAGDMELECSSCHGEAPAFSAPGSDVCSDCH
jgi:hypothetical protein